ncbi:MAG: hypothetical protein ACXABK_03730 [Candidatus Heimdallarchaeaceae archaeon]|jgi:hypothetical protein
MKIILSKKIIIVLAIVILLSLIGIIIFVSLPRVVPHAHAIKTWIELNEIGDGNYTVVIDVKAVGEDLIFDDKIDCSPNVAFIRIDTLTPITILDNMTEQISITDSFHKHFTYTIAMTFTYFRYSIMGIAEFTPS